MDTNKNTFPDIVNKTTEQSIMKSFFLLKLRIQQVLTTGKPFEEEKRSGENFAKDTPC